MNISIDVGKVSVVGGKVVIDIDPKQKEWLDATLKTMLRVSLLELNPQDEFKLGDEVFIVLEQTATGTKVIAKEPSYRNKIFGDTSDWTKSPIRELLNTEYFKKISKIIGKDNIVPVDRNLTSLDGLDDYGLCCENISLLTSSEYARYHKILGLNSHYKNLWWTITSASTPSNGYARYVCCVDSSGVLDWYGCVNVGGVRPFLKLRSSIIVERNVG